MTLGKTGYCSLCKSPAVKEINESIKVGNSYTATLETVAPTKFSKGTYYTHKAHITSPLITAAEAAKKNPVVVPQNNKAVLEMIRDLGMRKVIENPESITVNQTLRAASILSEKDSKLEGFVVVMAKLLQREPEMIEGEYTEVPRLTMEVNNESTNN